MASEIPVHRPRLSELGLVLRQNIMAIVGVWKRCLETESEDRTRDRMKPSEPCSGDLFPPTRPASLSGPTRNSSRSALSSYQAPHKAAGSRQESVVLVTLPVGN